VQVLVLVVEEPVTTATAGEKKMLRQSYLV
jgi:hypothetical protein